MSAEIGELLHVLKLHEIERILRAIAPGHPELQKPLIGDVLEVLAHVAHREAGDAAAGQVLGELGLAGDGLLEHGHHLALHLVVEELRLFAAHRAHDLEGEGHVGALVAEDPARARGEAVEEAARAEEVGVGEGREEEALDAAGEAGYRCGRSGRALVLVGPARSGYGAPLRAMLISLGKGPR